ncbi:hypothetical protein PPTG_14023 [Phytophthora nicotianae INRA-310]|uniref:Uncharacterized protein n=1 Tax=Phytophthora nicotianae (strain INRA-310) TaxID=761204 RepID=W2PZA1_PHYN3|nr:hypothetical protein PPTG_14023 [Phytophthora nicotianae INRA-310]ETN06263.1 hypothetical protein PPTG_14023 [Phytophthora nicotianae INRA-310]
MAGNKDEEVEALEALRDKSAELVRYLDNINEKLMQMNHVAACVGELVKRHRHLQSQFSFDRCHLDRKATG